MPDQNLGTLIKSVMKAPIHWRQLTILDSLVLIEDRINSIYDLLAFSKRISCLRQKICHYSCVMTNFTSRDKFVLRMEVDHIKSRGHSITTWTRGGGWVVSTMSTNFYEG